MNTILTMLLAFSMQLSPLCVPNFEVEQPEYVVKVMDDHGSFMFTGSGSLLREDIVLSCNHNIRDRTPGSLSVEFKDGTTRKAEVIRTNKKHDLSMLRIDPVDFEPVLPGLRAPKVGDFAKVCGFPKAGPYAEVSGTINGTLKQPKGFSVDEEVIQGMSGGPVLDKDGRQVGVVWGSTDEDAYFTGFQTILDFLVDDLDDD